MQLGRQVRDTSNKPCRRCEIKRRWVATVLAKTGVCHLDYVIIVRGDRHPAHVAPVNGEIWEVCLCLCLCVGVGRLADRCVSRD